MNKPVTIKEIAKVLNISVSTVSRALNDYPGIGLRTRKRIKKMAFEMRYVRNQTAVFLKQGKTFTIGVILPQLSEAFFSAALTAIEDSAYQRNYKILAVQSRDDEQREKAIVEQMKNYPVDGLLISAAKTTSSFEHFEMLSQYNIPVVFFDRVPPLPNIHFVACNIEAGALEAVTFLLRKGHRIIGMINGPDTLVSSGERRSGYIKSMLKNRLKFDPSLIVNCDLSEVGAINALNSLMLNKRRPTAIVTFNDNVFLYASKYARKKQVQAGRKLEFASFANMGVMDFIDFPPVTSVEQFPAVQGQKAADILLDLLADGKNRQPQAFYQVSVDPKLIERQVDRFCSVQSV